MQTRHWNIAIGLLFIVLSLITLALWIPNDIETGVLVEEFRDISIGDAMAPTASAIAVLALSCALVLGSLFAARSSTSDEPKIGISTGNLTNIISMATVLGASLAIMVWAGPLLIKALQAAGTGLPEYRLLTNTVPYKYTGFALGGFILVTGLIIWIEGRISWQAVTTGFCAVFVLIAVYDIPFDSLLLPPNGEQQ